MQNLGLPESIGVKYIDGICTKFCLKLWFQDGFKCDPETKSQTVSS